MIIDESQKNQVRTVLERLFDFTLSINATNYHCTRQAFDTLIAGLKAVVRLTAGPFNCDWFIWGCSSALTLSAPIDSRDGQLAAFFEWFQSREAGSTPACLTDRGSGLPVMIREISGRRRNHSFAVI